MENNFGLNARKPVFRGMRTTKARIIFKLATSEIPILYLVSGAEETGLSPTLSEILKTGFVALGPVYLNTVQFSFSISHTVRDVIICFL